MNGVTSIELTVSLPFVDAGFEWDCRFIIQDGDATIRYAKSGHADTADSAWQAGLAWFNQHQNVVVDATSPSVG